jgi:putative FmdB family regulatory protein
MPIYAYRCATCGHAQDVLQKLSDPLLTVCPACGASTYAKQVTAAGFQLKGSGWYVTDFRGGNQPPAKKEGETAADAGAAAATPAPDKAAPGASTGSGDAKTPAAPAAAPTASPPPAPSSSGTSGSSGSGSS